MHLYNYNDSGIFTVITEARLCPMTERMRKVNSSLKQAYIIPANATTKPVPEYNSDTQYAKFIDNEWVIEDIPTPEPEIIYEEIIEPEPTYTPKAQDEIFGTDAYKLKHYAELRAAEYPLMTDYLDGIVKGDAAQVQAYIDACLAVKDKYPKE